MLTDKRCHRGAYIAIDACLWDPQIRNKASFRCTVRLSALQGDSAKDRKNKSATSKLESHWFTQIFIADGNPATYFTYEFGVFYKGLVFPWVAYLIAKVVQITKVFVVAGVRQTCLCHCIYLRKKVSALILYLPVYEV